MRKNPTKQKAVVARKGTPAPPRHPKTTATSPTAAPASPPLRRVARPAGSADKKAELIAAANAPRQASKLAIITALLTRPHGATLVELAHATAWQPHSLRAALSGLRKSGRSVLRTKDGDTGSRYRLSGAKTTIGTGS